MYCYSLNFREIKVSRKFRVIRYHRIAHFLLKRNECQALGSDDIIRAGNLHVCVRISPSLNGHEGAKGG